MYNPLYFFIALSWLHIALCRTSESEYAKAETNYYEIYEAIETLNSITTHRTFYGLLGVSPEASDEEVSKAFRKTSILWHPDKLQQQGKWDEKSEKMSKLVQFVGSLMRSEKGRKEYDWVLNEAPAWHRQSVYVIKKLVPSSKLTIKQVIAITLMFSIGIHLIAQWIGYAVKWYMILSSRYALRGMGKKEVERIRKRMIGADPNFIAMNNATYHTILLADSQPPSIPSPLDLWVFQLPIWVIRKALGVFGLVKFKDE